MGKLYGTVAMHPTLNRVGCQRPDGTWVCRVREDDPRKINADYLVQFVPAFGGLFKHDIGKRIYLSDGVYQMENDQQRDARLAKPVVFPNVRLSFPYIDPPLPGYEPGGWRNTR